MEEVRALLVMLDISHSLMHVLHKPRECNNFVHQIAHLVISILSRLVVFIKFEYGLPWLTTLFMKFNICMYLLINNPMGVTV